MSFAKRGLARAITGFAGAQVITQNADTEPELPPQAIYYANHSSHLDFLTIWAALPDELQKRARPIAAKDYWGSGIRKSMAEKVFNAYLVDRHGSSSTRQRASDSGVSPKGQIQGMTEVLDQGDSLIIFPEGTRGDGESIATFRGGLYRLAEHNPQIPVVPVTLVNVGRILPKGEVIPVPHLSKVVFCEPIRVQPGEDQGSFLTRARAVLIGCLTDHQANFDGEGDNNRENDGAAPPNTENSIQEPEA
ncbi:lysophospholipid acyltransferase family protein [Nesterenkonia ebinurensis]|uniref:lysophospholipid acyltransferase family protein n=1 Tax=Nesterenkonia ebinurensis TaxID=2608252 RepID=UPI00123DCEB1|nr:lysophospholipid acyltransferase family protein [Nesterenkonia ebinurensis]